MGASGPWGQQDKPQLRLDREGCGIEWFGLKNARLSNSKSCHVPLDQVALSPGNLALDTFRAGTSTASLSK